MASRRQSGRMWRHSLGPSRSPDFKEYQSSLMQCRDNLESLAPGTSDNQLARVVKSNQEVLKNASTDLKAFKAFYRSYYPDLVAQAKQKARGAGKAAGPKAGTV